MKSALEKTYEDKRERSEALVKEGFGDEALEMMCSFSDLDCIIDLKLEAEWRRYVLIEGDGGEPDSLRRIG